MSFIHRDLRIGFCFDVFPVCSFVFLILFCYGSFIYFEIVSLYVAQAGLKFLILLSQPAETGPHCALFCCVIRGNSFLTLGLNSLVLHEGGGEHVPEDVSEAGPG